jgi:WD40 repeat protein
VAPIVVGGITADGYLGSMPLTAASAQASTLLIGEQRLGAASYNKVRGDYLAVGDDVGNVVVWFDQEEVWRYPAHQKRVRAVKWTGDWIFSASEDGTVRAWYAWTDPGSEKPSHPCPLWADVWERFEREQLFDWHLRILMFAGGSTSEYVRSFQAEELPHPLKGLKTLTLEAAATECATSCATFEQNATVACSCDSTYRCAERQMCLPKCAAEKFTMHYETAVRALDAVEIDNELRILAGTQDGVVRIYVLAEDFSNSEAAPVQSELGMDNPYRVFAGVTERQSRSALLSRYEPILVRLNVVYFRGHEGTCTTVAWHPFYPYIFASGGIDGFVFLWDGAQESSLFLPPLEPLVRLAHSRETAWPRVRGADGLDRGVLSVAWHPDGRLLSGGVDGRIILWHVHCNFPSCSGTVERILKPAEPVTSVAASPDGVLLAARTASNAMIWRDTAANTNYVPYNPQWDYVLRIPPKEVVFEEDDGEDEYEDGDWRS